MACRGHLRSTRSTLLTEMRRRVPLVIEGLHALATGALHAPSVLILSRKRSTVAANSTITLLPERHTKETSASCVVCPTHGAFEVEVQAQADFLAVCSAVGLR
jgi:hypothetical protein